LPACLEGAGDAAEAVDFIRVCLHSRGCQKQPKKLELAVPAKSSFDTFSIDQRELEILNKTCAEASLKIRNGLAVRCLSKAEFR